MLPAAEQTQEAQRGVLEKIPKNHLSLLSKQMADTLKSSLGIVEKGTQRIQHVVVEGERPGW